MIIIEEEIIINTTDLAIYTIKKANLISSSRSMPNDKI